MVACLCASTVSQALATASTSWSQGSNSSRTVTKLSSTSGGLRVSSLPVAYRGWAGSVERSRRGGVVCMAPEEEKMTRRSPLDFPIISKINKVLLNSIALSSTSKCVKSDSMHARKSPRHCLGTKEWERPKPGRRPDIFPKFSPMKTPLPTPLPADPPEEDEEEEENKEEEEDPEKEEEETEKPQSF